MVDLRIQTGSGVSSVARGSQLDTSLIIVGGLVAHGLPFGNDQQDAAKYVEERVHGGGHFGSSGESETNVAIVEHAVNYRRDQKTVSSMHTSQRREDCLSDVVNAWDAIKCHRFRRV
jgi:hypothetical protein